MKDFQFTNAFQVSPEMKAAYEEDGFVLIRGLLSDKEVEHVCRCAENSKQIEQHAHGCDDGKNRKSRMCVWNYPGNDVMGMVGRSEKIVTTLEQLMGVDELYHYHSKLMMKDPYVGGAHIWHQDYGYWYENGCLLPEMASIFLPLDKCTKENSCLQVLKGSHKMGRVDHILVGQQAGADPERVKHAQDLYELVYVEMDPGDALFFDCNLLHTSSQNVSPLRRWVLIPAYNSKRNNPIRDHHHSRYVPLKKVPNSAILECTKLESDEEKWFMKQSDDKSAASLINKRRA